MRYAWFPGCKIPWHLPQYGQATRAVCASLGIKLVDLEFGCCGYPSRHVSFEASMYAAARNFALAERAGLPILTPCKCCFGNLRHGAWWLRESPELADAVRRELAREGLSWPTRLEAVHLLTALDDPARGLGAARIASLVSYPLHGVHVAAHYGCHALRPGYVTGFDNPLEPSIFERLIHAAGATPVRWSMRLECCGNPLWGKNDDMAARLALRKLADAAASGADALCTACTYCQLQFDTMRRQLAPWATPGALEQAPPAVLFPQLLGLALGLSATELGITENAQAPARLLAAVHEPAS